MEGQAVWVITNFLQEPALISVERVADTVNKITINKPRLVIYITVVNKLLSRFASDQNLAKSNTEIVNMRQHKQEVPTGFQDRLTKAAARIGSAYSTKQLFEYFRHGVDPDVQRLVQQRWVDTTQRLQERGRLDGIEDQEEEALDRELL